MAQRDICELATLKAGEAPERLRVDYYFDFDKHPFRHRDLLQAPGCNSVVSVLDHIGAYARKWLEGTIETRRAEWELACLTEADYPGRSSGHFSVLLEEDAEFEPGFIQGSGDPEQTFTLFVSRGAHITGANIFLEDGDIYIGEETTVEPSAGIKGPAVIGDRNDIRQGAYLRGEVIVGDGGTFRGELKNVVMMDDVEFPHPCYVGDSLCGYHTHFGNQATSANLGIYAGVAGKENVRIELDGRLYDLGRAKIGIVLGDYSQVGCNSVSDPGTFLAPWTIVYQLSRLNKGFYGPHELVKNKPIEHGVIERGPLRR